MQYEIRDISDVIDKEAQLSREVARKTGSDGRKVFDFHFQVDDFTRRVKSDDKVFSLPWYVPQLDTCLKGLVGFTTDSRLEVRLIDGPYPKLVGLQAKPQKQYKYYLCCR